MLITGKSGKVKKPYLSKRLRDSNIPFEVRRIMDRMHYTATLEIIAEEFNKRFAMTTTTFTPAEKQQIVEYAFYVHLQNVDLYWRIVKC